MMIEGDRWKSDRLVSPLAASGDRNFEPRLVGRTALVWAISS